MSLNPEYKHAWIRRRRSRLGGGSASLPGSPLLRYDPSDATNYTESGGNVTAATDLGSGGLDLTKSGAANITLAELSNGLNGFVFGNGADAKLENTTALTDNQDWTVAFVVNVGTGSTTDINGLLGWSNATRLNGWRVGNTGADLCTFTARQYTSDPVQVLTPSGEGSAAIFLCTFEDSVGIHTYKNGTQVAEDVALAVNNTGSTSTQIGLGRFAGTTGAMGMTLGEVVVYQSLLNTADQATLFEYLNDKWAVY
jgi:hypothetical protein